MPKLIIFQQDILRTAFLMFSYQLISNNFPDIHSTSFLASFIHVQIMIILVQKETFWWCFGSYECKIKLMEKKVWTKCFFLQISSNFHDNLTQKGHSKKKHDQRFVIKLQTRRICLKIFKKTKNWKAAKLLTLCMIWPKLPSKWLKIDIFIISLIS